MKQKTELEKVRTRIWLSIRNNGFFLLTAYGLLPTSIANSDELRDVKPPVSLPETPWLLIILVAAGVILIAAGLWQWLRERRNFKKPVIRKSPGEIAYERLQDLRQRDLFGQGMAKEHFVELSDIERQYIEGRFNIHASEMTTEEFLESVNKSPLLEQKHKEILRSFLRMCDMVKFAKYGPSAQEALHSFELVRTFVDETKEIPAPAEGAKGQSSV